MIHAHRRRSGVATGSLWESGSITAISAGAAGAVAAVVTTPIDVVKTRIMLAASDESGSDRDRERAKKEVQARGGNPKAELERAQQAARGGRAGGIAIGAEIWRTEGLKGLFRGGLLRGLWTAVGSGLYLGVYESGRKYLENRRVGTDRDDGHEV